MSGSARFTHQSPPFDRWVPLLPDGWNLFWPMALFGNRLGDEVLKVYPVGR